MLNWLKSLAINWLIVALVLWFSPQLLRGISLADFQTALVVSFTLGVLLSTLKPVLKWLLFPVHFLSLGLFSIGINILCLFIAGLFLPGFEITQINDGVLLSLGITLATIVVKIVL